MPKGPFPTGVPVEGAQLIGREKELKQLTLLLQDGQSVIIVSPRRYGKTSLILEVLKRLKQQGFLTADVDLFYTASKREFAEKIVESTLYNQKGVFRGFISKMKESFTKFLHSIEIKSIVDRYEFILSFADPKIEEDSLLDSALDFPEIFAEKNKKEMLFSYDEFGDILKLDGNVLIKKMRAKFQRHKKVTYLFAGSEETLMRKLFTNKKQAFYRFGRILELDAIEKEAFFIYIKDVFKKYKIECPNEYIYHILDFTEGHPYYTQLVCQQIFYSAISQKKKIEKEAVKEGIFNAIISERSALDSMFENLSKRKYAILILEWLALGKGSPYEITNVEKQKIYQALISLQVKGLIKRVEKGRYKIRDPLFQEYFRLRKKEII